MGALLIDAHTKGFTDLSPVSASQSVSLDKTTVSPALQQLLSALKEHGNTDKPTEIVIGIRGKQDHVFSVTIDDLKEIQEILQWTIGRE